MLASHAHACGCIYLRVCGCQDCNADLPGLLSSQGSCPCCLQPLQLMFSEEKAPQNHIPWDKQVQGHPAKREMVQPLQQGSSRPIVWSNTEEAGLGDVLAVHGWPEGT